MKTRRRAILALFIGLATLASAEPAKTGHRESAPAIGLATDLSLAGAWVPSWEATRPFLSAAGFSTDLGLEASWAWLIPLRAELSLFSVGNSGFDPSLFLYRAFWGWRFALETGLQAPLFGGELALLAGLGFSASEYTGTSLVNAYWSALAELRYSHAVAVKGLPGFRLEAGVPFEYLWRGAASSLSLGFSVGAGMSLGKGGRR